MHWYQLDEILQHIFQYLHPTDVLSNTIRTCKQFATSTYANTTQVQWDLLFCKPPQPLEFELIQFFAHFSAPLPLFTTFIKLYSIFDCQHFAPFVGQVKVLNLAFFDEANELLDQSVLQTLFSHASKLQELAILEHDLPASLLLHVVPTLKSLKLYKAQDEHIKIIGTHFTVLEKLSIEQIRISDEQESDFIDVCLLPLAKTLTELDICEASGLLSQLTRLQNMNMQRYVSPDFSSIKKHAESLTELCLPSESSWSDIQLLQELPNLKSISGTFEASYLEGDLQQQHPLESVSGSITWPLFLELLTKVKKLKRIVFNRDLKNAVPSDVDVELMMQPLVEELQLPSMNVIDETFAAIAQLVPNVIDLECKVKVNNLDTYLSGLYRLQHVQIVYLSVSSHEDTVNTITLLDVAPLQSIKRAWLNMNNRILLAKLIQLYQNATELNVVYSGKQISEACARELVEPILLVKKASILQFTSTCITQDLFTQLLTQVVPQLIQFTIHIGKLLPDQQSIEFATSMTYPKLKDMSLSVPTMSYKSCTQVLHAIPNIVRLLVRNGAITDKNTDWISLLCDKCRYARTLFFSQSTFSEQSVLRLTKEHKRLERFGLDKIFSTTTSNLQDLQKQVRNARPGIKCALIVYKGIIAK